MIADAVADGLMSRSAGKSGEQAEGVVAGDEPLAEWERELLGGQAAQAAESAAPEAGETAAADAPALLSRRGRGRSEAVPEAAPRLRLRLPPRPPPP